LKELQYWKHSAKNNGCFRDSVIQCYTMTVLSAVLDRRPQSLKDFYSCLTTVCCRLLDRELSSSCCRCLTILMKSSASKSAHISWLLQHNPVPSESTICHAGIDRFSSTTNSSAVQWRRYTRAWLEDPPPWLTPWLHPAYCFNLLW